MLHPLVYLHELRWAEVVVRLPGLLQRYQPVELLSRRPIASDLGHRPDALLGEGILGLLLDEIIGGVYQQNLPGPLLGRVKLACRLALPLGKLSQQVLVGPTQNIGLCVLQAQTVTAEDLYQGAQPVVIQTALAALPLVVILDIQNALQIGIEAGDLSHGRRHELAQAAVSAVVPYRLPAVALRDVKTDDGRAAGLEGVSQIRFNDAPGQLPILVFLDMESMLTLRLTA